MKAPPWLTFPNVSMFVVMLFEVGLLFIVVEKPLDVSLPVASVLIAVIVVTLSISFWYSERNDRARDSENIAAILGQLALANVQLGAIIDLLKKDGQAKT